MKENSGVKLVIWSGVIAVGLLGLVWVMFPISFETNDDKAIMYWLAGYSTGTPMAASGFSNFLWGVLVSTFYKTFPGIAWYPILTQIVIAVSSWSICYNLALAFSVNRNLFEGILAYILIFVGFLIFYSDVIQFTVTAAFGGLAALSIVIYEEYYKNKSFAYFIFTLMLMLSLNIRFYIGEMVVASCLVILAGYYLTKRRKKEYIIFFVLLLSSTFFSVTSNWIFEKVTGVDEYRSFNSQRTQFIDYEVLPFVENREVYESVDWDEELFALARQNFFMDDRINETALKKINTVRNEKIGWYGIDYIFKFFFRESFLAGELLISVVWEVLFILLLFKKDNQKMWQKSVVLLGSQAIFWTFVVWFVCIKGRMNARLCEAGVFVFVVPGILLYLRRYSKVYSKNGRQRYGTFNYNIYITMLVIIVIMNCISYVGLLNKTFHFAFNEVKRKNFEMVSNLEKYALKNLNNVYIYDLSLAEPIYPYTVYTDLKPTNVFIWGGSFYQSSMYYKQLEQNGLSSDNLYSILFLNDNVFMCGIDINEELCKYMKKVNHKCKVEVIDREKDFVIYKFSK